MSRRKSQTLPVLLLVLALSLSLAACGPDDGTDSFGPSANELVGTLFDDPTSRQPIAGARITIEATGTIVTTDAAGIFRATDVPSSRVLAELSDGSQNIYTLTVQSKVEQATVEFFADPIFGDPQTADVAVAPDVAQPAGTATITDPQNGGVVSCPLAAPCRFFVAGVANPLLGQPGTPFNLYVFVTPISPSGGGTFPQFPAVSIDPATGEWQFEAQIGSEDVPVRPGDRFQILAIVTSATLTQGTAADPLRFDRPIDVPGVVHISPFVTLTVGAQ